MPNRYAALFVLALPILLTACSGASGPAGPPNGPELFKKHCASCHGLNGKGLVANIDMTSPQWQRAHTDEQIQKTVNEGIQAKDNSMPPFKTILKDDEIQAIIKDMIRKFGKEGK
jgi:mono/diheme cytochrome c family protein